MNPGSVKVYPHGNRNRYKAGCKCERCMEANRKHSRSNRAKKERICKCGCGEMAGFYPRGAGARTYRQGHRGKRLCFHPTCEEKAAWDIGLCHRHYRWIEAYGGLFPILPCAGCGRAFVKDIGSGRSKIRNRVCNECLPLLDMITQGISKYGISREALKRIVRQRGKCSACKEDFSSSRRPMMDHDHSCCPVLSGENLKLGHKKTCGKCNRGFLCSSCNLAVGIFERGDRFLIENYLRSWYDRAA